MGQNSLTPEDPFLKRWGWNSSSLETLIRLTDVANRTGIRTDLNITTMVSKLLLMGYTRPTDVSRE